MPERDDPLELLRGGWDAIEAPDPTPETVDPETAEAVEWMRAAWSELRPPLTQVPAWWKRRLLIRRLPELGRLAVAAVILAIGLLSIGVFLDPGASMPAPAPATHRVVVAESEGGDLVVEHGCVRLVMIVPEYDVGALDGLDARDVEKRR